MSTCPHLYIRRSKWLAPDDATVPCDAVHDVLLVMRALSQVDEFDRAPGVDLFPALSLLGRGRRCRRPVARMPSFARGPTAATCISIERVRPGFSLRAIARVEQRCRESIGIDRSLSNLSRQKSNAPARPAIRDRR